MTPQEIEVITNIIKDEVKAQAGSYLTYVDITESEYTAAAIKILRAVDLMRKNPGGAT